MYPKKIYLDYGSGWVDISRCVYYKSITITNRASSDDYHKAQDVASFTLIYDAAIFSGIYNATSDIGVYIEDDLENRLFTGIIPPTMNRTYNGKLDNTTISLEATDSSESLKKEVGDVLYESYKVMDPANKSASIIHQLAYIAGFTDDQIDQTITIDITYNYFSPNNEKDKILEIMDVLLFENGYVFNMNEYDKISPVKWIDDASPAVEFNENNIVEEIEINEQEIEFDAIDLYYYDVGSKDNVRIYTADLPFDEDHGYEGYPVDAGTFWPVEANATDRITGANKVIYQEYEDVGIKYLTNEAIAKGLDYNYKAFDSDFSSIIATKNHVLSPTSISGLTTVSGTFGNKKAHILYKNNTAEFQNIYYMHIDSTVIYKSTERLLRHGVAVDSERADKYNSYYIFDETSADKLSSNMVQMYKSGNILYEFESETEAAPGSFAQVVTNDGTDQLCFVLERTYIEEKRMFKYKLKGYNYNEGVIIYEENKKHNSNNQVADVITVITEVSSTIPDDVTAMSAVAAQDSVNLSVTIPQASGVQNGIVGIIMQRSKDGGTNYYDILGSLNGIATVPPGNFQWSFNRSTDGYPEKTGAASPWIALENYRFRVKGVNAAGVASENWTYSGAPNTTGYKTWLSGTPANGRGTSTARMVEIKSDLIGNVYGYARTECQISMNDTNWFEPQTGLDPNASEDNWRQSATENNFRSMSVPAFTTTLPLSGQANGVAVDTGYYFRFRFVTDRAWSAGSPAGYVESSGLTAGPWSSSIPVIAKTGVADSIRSAMTQVVSSVPGILGAWSPNSLGRWPDDPAGTTYLNHTWATVDGWSGNGGSVSVSGGSLFFEKTGASQYLAKNISIPSGSTLRGRVRFVSGTPSSYSMNIVNTVFSPTYKVLPSNGEWVIFDVISTSSGDSVGFYLGNFAGAETYILEYQFIYIGTGAYLPGALPDLTDHDIDLDVYGAVPNGEDLIFDGVNDYLRTRDEIEMPDLFTFHAKLKVPISTSNQQVFYYFGVVAVNRIALSRAVNTRSLLLQYITTGFVQMVISDFFPASDDDSVTLDLAIDFPNEKLYVYKNGLFVSEHDVTGIVKPTSSYWYFGKTSSSADYCKGTFSHLRVFDSLLSASEVMAMYQNPNGIFPGVVIAKAIKTPSLTAIHGNLCVIEGEVEDPYNYWTMADYPERPSTRVVGSRRIGDADDYDLHDPGADDTEADPKRIIKYGDTYLKMYHEGGVGKMKFNGIIAADGLVGATAASTVESNAANGATAYTGTEVYRNTNVPNGTLTRTEAPTVAAANDGSREITLAYNLTALGSLPPDFLVIFYNIGDASQSAPTVATNMGRVTIPISATGAGTYKFTGVPADKYVYFAIGMARNTAGGVKYSALQTFTQVTPGTVAIAAAATLGGVTGTNIAANDTWLRAGAPNGSFSSHACTVEDNADGTINLNITWVFTQSTVVADRILIVVEKGTSNPGAVGTINDGDVYEVPATQTGFKLSGLPSATLSGGTATKLIYSVGAFAAKPNITGGTSVGSVSSPAGWQNKSGTSVAITIDADNFWNLLTGELKVTIGENQYLHLDPDTATAILYNILFKTFTGEGVFRRALQIDAHNMDWLNSPVGDTEQLHGRIGRLGPYGPVLLDGPFDTNLESTWSDEEVINNANTFDPAYIQLQTGELRISYERTGDYYLVERIYDFDTSTWGSEIVINAAGMENPAYIQLQAGELRIAYLRRSDYYLVERIYDFDTSTWGSEIVINDESENFKVTYIQLQTGELRIAYIKDGGNLVERIYDFDTSTWGSEIVINAGGLYPAYIQLQTGELRIAYSRRSDYYLVERIYDFDTSTWGSEIVINAADSRYPAYIQLQTGELRIAYRYQTTGYILERIYDFDTSTWGSEYTLSDLPSSFPCYIQLQAGELRIAYIASPAALVERRLQRYARLGAGVIESGHDVTGDVESWWQVFSDGTMELWQKVDLGSVACTTAWGNLFITAEQSRISFPIEFNEVHTCEIQVLGSNPGATVVLKSNSYALVTDSQGYYLWRATSETLTGVYVSVRAKGKVII